MTLNVNTRWHSLIATGVSVMVAQTNLSAVLGRHWKSHYITQQLQHSKVQNFNPGVKTDHIDQFLLLVMTQGGI